MCRQESFLFFISIQLSFHWVFPGELIQIQTLTRHGERSPCFSYPADPYKHLWTKSLGQLTENGIIQLKEVGSFLRSYYKDFLPKVFHKKEIYIKSSDTDRTICSALACMSTLFINQIVPVHTVPKSYDYLLKMTSVCPHHKKLLTKEFNSEKYREKINRYKPFFKQLEAGTGLSNVDIHLALRICDAITVWSQLNLTLPDWLGLDGHRKCVDLGHMKFIISYSNTELTKFRGGPLAINMVDGMVKRAQAFSDRSRSSEPVGLKMIAFFSHDSTLSAFLSHMGSFNLLKPPLASTVILELYHEPEPKPESEYVSNENNKNDPALLLSQFSVRLLYRNQTDRQPTVLNMSVCVGGILAGSRCRLDVLHRQLSERTVKDLPRQCGVSNIIDHLFASNDKLKLMHDDTSLDNIINENVDMVRLDDKPGSRVSKYESDLFVNIFVPILLLEIFVLYLFYRLCRR